MPFHWQLNDTSFLHICFLVTKILSKTQVYVLLTWTPCNIDRLKNSTGASHSQSKNIWGLELNFSNFRFLRTTLKHMEGLRSLVLASTRHPVKLDLCASLRWATIHLTCFVPSAKSANTSSFGHVTITLTWAHQLSLSVWTFHCMEALQVGADSAASAVGLTRRARGAG